MKLCRLRTVDFVVEGHCEFPLDMLRYDCCHPVYDVDAALIHHSWTSVPRKIILRHTGNSTAWTPTLHRWAYFSWIVIAINGEDITPTRKATARQGCQPTSKIARAVLT